MIMSLCLKMEKSPPVVITLGNKFDIKGCAREIIFQQSWNGRKNNDQNNETLLVNYVPCEGYYV